jgi:hypothetical protein
MIINHENDFLRQTSQYGFIISIGTKGSGKSFTMNGFLRHSLSENTFKHYHLVLPCYKGEQNDSYDFLKNQKQCMIYPHYAESVCKKVDADRKKGRTLFIIDDASGELLNNIDHTFIMLITTLRHFEQCVVWICAHSMRKLLSPIIRQNLESLFIYRIINRKLLEDLYEEYFSMFFPTSKEFINFYKDVSSEKYSCIHFSIHYDGIDSNVKDWEFVKRKTILKATHGKPKPKPKDGKIDHGHFFSKMRFGK